MNQHHLTIRDIRISYIEKNTAAKNTIFFIHGNSASSGIWKKQMGNGSLDDYRLVAIDLPAHGASTFSPSPERDYTLAGLASILTEIIEELSPGPFMLCGLSLGTNILAEMIPFGIHPEGIFFAGPSLMGDGLGMDKMVIPGVDISALLADDPSTDIIMQYGKVVCHSPDPEDLDDFVIDFKNVQPPFRSLFIQSIFNGNLGDEIKQVNSISCPLAWVFGADDQVIDPDYLDEADIPKWKEQIFKIPGASHFVNVDQPEAFNKLLSEFAREVF